MQAQTEKQTQKRERKRSKFKNPPIPQNTNRRTYTHNYPIKAKIFKQKNGSTELNDKNLYATSSGIKKSSLGF